MLASYLHLCIIIIMTNNYTKSFEDLCVVPVYSYSEADEMKERAEDAYYGDEYDEEMYRGLRPKTIRTILDKVGEVGNNPIMATLLFRAGVAESFESKHTLYSEYAYQYVDSPPKLFGVYFDADRLRADAEPDALLLAQGYGRKAYRGYETIMTDFWGNPDRPEVAAVERAARDMAQLAMLSDYAYTDYLFVNQQTVIHEIMGAEKKTVSELGITPEDYYDGYDQPAPVNRIGQIERASDFSGRPELLEAYKSLYQTLNPEADFRGGEGEDIYELRLSDEKIAALNRLMKYDRTNQITGLSIDREDREKEDVFLRRQKDETSPFYTNGWGDMTIRLQLELDNVVRCYTLRVYMDSGQSETYLNKYTAELRQTSGWIAKEAGHMLDSMQDPLAEEMNLNHIDEFEYQDLLKLVQNVQAVATLT